jgi:hypothetical protein
MARGLDPSGIPRRLPGAVHWIGGHADVLRLLADGAFLADAAAAHWEPFAIAGA